MTLRELVRRRWRLAIILSAIVIIAYFGFVILIAFDKTLLATRIAPGLSLGILLGALVIVITWLVTWYYVRWARVHFDDDADALRAAAAQGKNNKANHGGDR